MNNIVKPNNRFTTQKKEKYNLFHQKQEQNLKEILTMENFPCLIKKEQPNINFVKIDTKQETKTKTKQETKQETENTIKYNIECNKPIIKKLDEKTDEEIWYDTLKYLTELYEKRTNEYIELNGYDTWEHMFKFPDWREREQEQEQEQEEYNISSEDEDL